MRPLRSSTFRRLGGALFVAVTAPVLRAQEEAPSSPFPPFDRQAFEAACTKAGADQSRIDEFHSDIQELGLGLAADYLMRDVHPAFGSAVDLSEEGDPRAALELTKVLAGTQDKILQGFTRYHLARVFLDGDDPEGAVKVLDQFLQENSGKTPLDGEAVYFYASALAEVPMAKTAMEIFNAYLQWFPDAPERFRATAHQRLQELLGQEDIPLHGLANDMKWCERRIRKLDTGEEVQEKQKAAIDLLQQLIEEMEEKEKQSGGAPSGNGQSQAPASRSALPEGTHRMGNLRDVKEVADRWAEMPERDRQAIEAEAQESLPESHKALLRDYYNKLGKGRK